MPDPGAVAIDLPAPGPLKVHPANRRYFTDGTGRAVYLTGSHTWNVLHDPDPAKSPPFAYGAYLDLLHRHHHNFFRLWARMDTGGGPPAPLPTVYVRTGPGNAQDGLPKYNLERYNDAFLAVRSSRNNTTPPAYEST